MPTAFAIFAHPDDIEFSAAGTLLLLREAGWATHYLNLSSGNLGTTTLTPTEARQIRLEESREAASILGCTHHPPFCDDLEIFYDNPTLRHLAALIRSVQPDLILTHAREDYMEDHMTTSRLAVTAAFARGMPNYETTPITEAIDNEVVIYHAMPHGLRDPLGRPVFPGSYVDTSSVQDTKRLALARHRSQKEWLDVSQGMDSYLQAMDDMSEEVGRLSKRFDYAEGWTRHFHLGFSAEARDPLGETLGNRFLLNRETRN
ncbi:MAG: PIG-L family deacetylase [Verrucomicrobiota bacterium]